MLMGMSRLLSLLVVAAIGAGAWLAFVRPREPQSPVVATHAPAAPTGAWVATLLAQRKPCWKRSWSIEVVRPSRRAVS